MSLTDLHPDSVIRSLKKIPVKKAEGTIVTNDVVIDTFADDIN